MLQAPITVALCLISVLVTLGKETQGFDFRQLAMTREALGDEPWRMVTSVFPHGGVIHLLFSLLWTWRLGSAIELTLESWRTLALFLLVGSLSSTAQFALDPVYINGIPYGGIGLSGVVYGYFGFLWVLDRRDDRFRGVITPSITRIMVIWFFLCILLPGLNVANWAHGAGLVTGLLLGAAMGYRGLPRILAGGGLAASLAIAVLAV